MSNISEPRWDLGVEIHGQHILLPMATTLSHQLQNIQAQIEAPSVESLDIMTAYYLGIQSVHPDGGVDVLAQLKQLCQLKTSLRFLDRLIIMSGSVNLTPDMKLQLASAGPIMPMLRRLNDVVGRDISILEPLADQLDDPEVQRSYLDYESEAHRHVVEAIVALPSIPPPTRPAAGASASMSKLYIPSNVGRSFVSFDLRQANWTATRSIHPSLPSWEDFIRPHLPPGPFQDVLLRSKMFRQITLGVGFKRSSRLKAIESIQMDLTRRGSDWLIRRFGQPFCSSNDEMIFSGELPKLPPHVDSRFHLTQLKICRADPDGGIAVECRDLTTGRVWTQIRCLSPDCVQDRLRS